jgi:hypothetical protein
MTASDILDRLNELGVSVRIVGDKVRVTPVSKVPGELLAEAKAHKAEIVQELRPPYSDGKPPPLDRPLAKEQELRRWMDHTADEANFDRWLAWALEYTDPAEAED